MPIIQSAKKALRSSGRKRVFNLRRARTLKTTLKETRELVSTNVKDAQKKLSDAYQAIDKAAKRGLIKKNTASRKKSRLAALIKKASTK
jgi:small subunit ribosomal protein S20